jgi:hypothetical protein
MQLELTDLNPDSNTLALDVENSDTIDNSSDTNEIDSEPSGKTGLP